MTDEEAIQKCRELGWYVAKADYRLNDPIGVYKFRWSEDPSGNRWRYSGYIDTSDGTPFAEAVKRLAEDYIAEDNAMSRVYRDDDIRRQCTAMRVRKAMERTLEAMKEDAKQEQSTVTPSMHATLTQSLRAMQYTGHNARDVAEFTGGKFEANGDDALYLDKTADVSVEIDPGTWIVHVPWSPVPYQYVSESAMREAFVVEELTALEEQMADKKRQLELAVRAQQRLSDYIAENCPDILQVSVSGFREASSTGIVTLNDPNNLGGILNMLSSSIAAVFNATPADNEWTIAATEILEKIKREEIESQDNDE